MINSLVLDQWFPVLFLFTFCMSPLENTPNLIHRHISMCEIHPKCVMLVVSGLGTALLDQFLLKGQYTHKYLYAESVKM